MFESEESVTDFLRSMHFDKWIWASTGFDGDDAALEAIRKTVALNFKPKYKR